MRTFLRAILAVALLLGSGVADWAPVQAGAQAHEACCCCGCCGIPAGVENRCPCPQPDGNRSPSQSLCLNRTIAVVDLAARLCQAERRAEPRPEPATWAQALALRELSGSPAPARGRDPDLGRHLARLNTFRI